MQMDRKRLMKPKGWVSKAIMESDDWVAEPKFDGHSGWLEFDEDGVMEAFSASRDVTPFLPRVVQPLLAGWILHVEFLSGTPSRSYRVATMLSGHTYRGLEDPGLAVFDVLQAAGVDMRGHRLDGRTPYVHKAIEHLRQSLGERMFVSTLVQAGGRDKYALYDAVVAIGGEGIVVKDVASTYTGGKSPSWRKKKVIRTVDAVAYDYSKGGGKYSHTLGALKVALWKEGELTPIARASGMTDEQRERFKERLDGGERFVVELAYQNWTSSHSLRHPRFKRVREDKAVTECTWADQGPQ